MLHVLLVIEDAVPDGSGSLLVSFLLTHRGRIVNIRVLEIRTESAHGWEHREAVECHGHASSAYHQTTSKHFSFQLIITSNIISL